MSPPAGSTDRVNQDWGGAPDQRFAPTNRDRKKWRPFQQGRSNRGPRNAPRAPRAMSSTLRQQQVPVPEPQMQLPLPRGVERGSAITNVSRPGPLPPGHPLKREMDELKSTRKKRQFYWAGLIENLGGDEWGNPANYDRQRWEDEERLADKKFEELAGQIKLAEMGYTLVASECSDQSRSASAAWGSDQGHTADAHHDRYQSDGQASVRMQHHGWQHRSPLNHRGRGGRLNHSVRGSNPNAPPRKELFWTQQKRVSAVNKWMDQMGMNTFRKTSSMEQRVMVGGATPSVEHIATNDEYSHQDDDLNDLRTVNSSYQHHETAKHSENSAPPHWTILDEVAFEEAEREREEERLLLGQWLEEDRKVRNTIEKDPGSALRPSRTVTLVNLSEEGLSRERRNPPGPDPGIMSALMKRLLEEQVGSPDPIQENAPASSQETTAMNETLDLTSRVVSDHHTLSRMSANRQCSTIPHSTGLSSTPASDISRKVSIEMVSSAVPEPPAPPETEAPGQDHTTVNVPAGLMEDQQSYIERLDMQNDVSSDGNETSLYPEPYPDGKDEDGFVYIEDTSRPSSPTSPDNSTPPKPTTSPNQEQPPPNLSALGLHYRNALKVNEMFSSTGTLLPPGPSSVAARLRNLRGSYNQYSNVIKRWAAARRDEDEVEGRLVVEGVSDWVDTRIWLADWRERLDM